MSQQAECTCTDLERVAGFFCPPCLVKLRKELNKIKYNKRVGCERVRYKPDFANLIPRRLSDH